MDSPEPIVLASASPRRAELLSAAGWTFVVDPADVDETVRSDEPAAEYVLRVARDKAHAIAARHSPSRIVLAADTTVVVDGAILGKPETRADAARMLRMLAGRDHEVLTAVVVRHRGGERSATDSAVVTFAPMSDAEIAWYVATGEADGKAGAYGIQGRAARFVARLQGSWSNVVGLPVETVHRLLKDLGA